MGNGFVLQVQQKNHEYIIVAAEFGVVVRNGDLRAGLQEAASRIDTIAAELRDAGVDATKARAPETSIRSDLTSNLWIAVAPSMGIAAALSALILLSSVPMFSAAASLRSAVDKVFLVDSTKAVDRAGQNAIDMVLRLSEGIDRVTPERKEELKLAVRKIMRGMSPIIQEIRNGGECSSTAPDCLR